MTAAQGREEEGRPAMLAIYKSIACRREKDYRRRLVASGRACRPYGSLGDDPLAVRVLTPRFERAEREFLPARIRRRLVRFLRSQAADTHPAAAPGPPDSQQADSLSDLYGGFRLFS